MQKKPTNRPRILVVIVSYGDKNTEFLLRVLAEYRTMRYKPHVIVLSNIAKALGPDVEVVKIDLTKNDPWSLPFYHKPLFASHAGDFDAFIYSEDDILITERNIRAFFEISNVLPEDESAGFFIKEVAPDGESSYPQAHGPFHWDADSVRARGPFTVAFFTNEHAACYMLTQKQLQIAIASGRFLVPPHQNRYDLPCTAATDPFTQCGLKKLIPISHFDEFLVHHLPNKYIGKFGVSERMFHHQIGVLLSIAEGNPAPPPLCEPETRLSGARFSKSYYEPAREDIATLIPRCARSVLSLGCGAGAMEASLARKGLRVVAAPMDCVISAGFEQSGIELVYGTFNAVRQQLGGERFDCIFISHLLHLVADPALLLSHFKDLLSHNATIIIVVPSLSSLPVTWRRVWHDRRFSTLGHFDEMGVHITSRSIVCRWFEQAGLRLETWIHVLPSRFESAGRFAWGLMTPFLASEFVVVARK